MQKNVVAELDKITQFITNSSHPISLNEIIESKIIEIPRRSLQRILSELVNNKKIALEGVGRGARYKSIELVASQKVLKEKDLFKIELTTKSLSLKKQVNIPLQKKKCSHL